MSGHVQVLTTAGSEREAELISATLVERGLAACVQTDGPVTSRYRWRGKVEVEREWRCLAKTKASLFPRVEAAIREVHSYEEPEILAIPIAAGSSGYLDWISAEVED
jgi:periplasmic divalent cation tolerance protein